MNKTELVAAMAKHSKSARELPEREEILRLVRP